MFPMFLILLCLTLSCITTQSQLPTSLTRIEMDYQYVGTTEYGYAGYDVSAAGDFNGDTYGDFIVGTQTSTSAYLVYGNSNPSSSSLSTLNRQNVVQFTGPISTGQSVSAAGNFNNDEFDDILIGAPGSGNGIAYLVYGKADMAGRVKLDSLTGKVEFIGPTDGVQFGFDVAGAGDVNNDDFDDIIIGAWSGDPPIEEKLGEVYVIFGAVILTESFDPTSVDGTNGIRIQGKRDVAHLGRAVAGVDFNNDGYSDILFSSHGLNEGYVYMIFGKDSYSNGNFDLNSLGGTNGVKFSGAQKDERLGWSLAGIDDFNGDGFNDFIIGSPRYNASSYRDGRVYVVYGQSQTFDGPTYSLTGLSQSRGLRIDGVASQELGTSVAGIGDFNRDGLGDIIFGGDEAAFNEKTESGSAYIMYGTRQSMNLVSVGDFNWKNGIQFVGAAAGDDMGSSVGGAGDFNSDGYADLVVGSPDVATSDFDRAGVVSMLKGFDTSCPEGKALNVAQRICEVPEPEPEPEPSDSTDTEKSSTSNVGVILLVIFGILGWLVAIAVGVVIYRHKKSQNLPFDAVAEDVPIKSSDTKLSDTI